MLAINNISKNFKSVRAVNNISLNVKTGDIYGFLGPNGAGKTTTIRMIMGIIKPDTGNIKIFDNNQNILEHNMVGYLPRHQKEWTERQPKVGSLEEHKKFRDLLEEV